MKKILKASLLATLLLICSTAVYAQQADTVANAKPLFSVSEPQVDTYKGHFCYGISFDVSFRQNSAVASQGIQKSVTYGVNLTPQFGYYINSRSVIGTRLSFLMNRTNTKEKEDYYDDAEVETDRNIGWDIAPFYRYKIGEFGGKKQWAVWVDAHVYAGMEFPNQNSFLSSYKNKVMYGVQVMPSISLKINEKMTFFANIALASLGYGGSVTNYRNGDKEYNNGILLYTSKLSGLINSLATEGQYVIKLGMMTKL